MLENLLKDFLGIEVREDYRETHKGEIRELNLDDICDQAYIRNRFRRHLKANSSKLEGIRMIDNYYQGTRYTFNNIDTLEGLNKVIDIMNFWIKNCINEGKAPLRVEVY